MFSVVTCVFLLYIFQVIFREESDSWINVSNILHILKTNVGGGTSSSGSQSSVDFLISSEETGFRHLYYVKAGLNMNQIPEGDEEVFRQKRLQPQILEKVALTSGDWSVSCHAIKVRLAFSFASFALTTRFCKIESSNKIM